MKSVFMELKDKLILIFFNNFHSNYFLNDLKKLLSLPSSILDDRIEMLIDQFFLETDDLGTIYLTEEGKRFLQENNLEEIFIPDILDNKDDENKLESLDHKPNQDINKVYIPTNFDKKL
jgi:hypothetical protein